MAWQIFFGLHIFVNTKSLFGIVKYAMSPTHHQIYQDSRSQDDLNLVRHERTCSKKCA
jgi:hypothetical protein